MVDTLSVNSVLHFVLSQIAYIFGINAGPEHLNGQNFREAPLWVTILIALADLMIAMLVIALLSGCFIKVRKWCLIYRRHSCLWHLSEPALSAPA